MLLVHCVGVDLQSVDHNTQVRTVAALQGSTAHRMQVGTWVSYHSSPVCPWE